MRQITFVRLPSKQPNDPDILVNLARVQWLEDASPSVRDNRMTKIMYSDDQWVFTSMPIEKVSEILSRHGLVIA
jgi:hypothetical protein